MSKNIVFQDSYLVSGIMCFKSCGNTVQHFLTNCFEDYKEENFLPKDAQLIIDAEPSFGLQRLFLTVQSGDKNFDYPEEFHNLLNTRFKENLELIEKNVHPEGVRANESTNTTNWINIVINLLAMAAILVLSLVFPPSIPLTIGLTAISFLTTAFTAREYLINFYHNLRNKNLANMATTISLGWLLSLAHTIFHSISMPLASSFSMIFMSYLMPVMLITFINGMDEIKRLVFNKSTKMNLEGMENLFPQMSKSYVCYQLEDNELISVAPWLNKDFEIEKIELAKLKELQELLSSKTPDSEKGKKILQAGMIIQVKRGECFPVDCILIDENTIVDASLLTGEPSHVKKFWDKIPAGAINLNQTVKVYAVNNSYNSTITRLLFPANRERATTAAKTTPKFIYIYTALIIAGITAAIIFPVALGAFTIALLLQNVMGILFSICPCTIAIALQLPVLISVYHRSIKGIQLRDESLSERIGEIHTFVFDKTGTLTTGDSKVESSTISSRALWHRIDLLEKLQGAEHPLAKAIKNYYAANFSTNPISFNEIKNGKVDSKNRGISGNVQGVPIHIGNAAFLQESKIKLPSLDSSKLREGFTPVYVAENNIYHGVIYIKHELRPGIVVALTRLKNEAKRKKIELMLKLLTGDTLEAALAFNKQIGSIFEESDIHAEQTPEKKEEFLGELMSSPEKAKKTCFVGDGLNDAQGATIVSEKGGISCAMNTSDKTAYFTDVCLNGSLDYLFSHNKINQFLQKSIMQNKAILVSSTLAFLAFIIGFSVAGIAVSPLIPLVIMLSTTLLIVYNSYRIQLFIDTALDKITSWPKQLLASDLSIGLLVLGSSLLICSILIATITTGGLALPVIVFTAGTAVALSSTCTLAAITLFSLFVILVGSYIVVENDKEQALAEQATPPNPLPTKLVLPLSPGIIEKETYDFRVSISDRTRAQADTGKEELEPCSYVS
ncbi:MAG: cation-translocating P-type ATPase [Tatlockia sp.]|nr:cation-translocating P-type ATPase [Tatlockia sp.]